jgi:hypothetical protein
MFPRGSALGTRAARFFGGGPDFLARILEMSEYFVRFSQKRKSKMAAKQNSRQTKMVAKQK